MMKVMYQETNNTDGNNDADGNNDTDAHCPIIDLLECTKDCDGEYHYGSTDRDAFRSLMKCLNVQCEFDMIELLVVLIEQTVDSEVLEKLLLVSGLTAMEGGCDPVLEYIINGISRIMNTR